MPFIYTFSTGSTEVYDASDYSAVDTLQAVSQSDISRIDSVYNINYQKIFAGPFNNACTGLTIYDSGNTKSVINISADTFGIAVDNTNDLVAIINTSNGGAIDNIVVVVDASTNTVVNTIDVGFNNSYKGGIASDNNGYCYVVGSESAMTKVDIVNGVTADTITIGGTGQINRKVFFNGVSNFIYVFSPLQGTVKRFDASDYSLLNTISITANTYFFEFNPDKEQIYFGNVTGGTNDLVITTLSRNLTKISETFIYSNSSGGEDVFAFYSTDTKYLYLGDINSDSILVLTT